MSDTITPPPASTPSNDRSPAVDLSREIEAAVEREPDDRVKCAHIFGPYYRCNWWSLGPQVGTAREPIAPWALLANQRIRKSRFLSATRTSSGKLKIEGLELIAAAVTR